MTPSSRRSLGHVGPAAVVVGCTIFFVLPLVAMARFALQSVPMVRLGWSTLFDKWSLSGITRLFSDEQFRSALGLSIRLALGTVALTLALLLPTTLWVHLRLPRARPLVEFLTVLPYVIPPIALVAGIVPLQPHAALVPQQRLLARALLHGAGAAVHVPVARRRHPGGRRQHVGRRLPEPRRGWGRTLTRALIPNLRAAIVSSAFLTAAVVLGEFTIASVLLKRTLPQFAVSYQEREPQAGMGLALLMILATTALFAVLTVVTRKRGMARAATIY